MAFLTAGTNFQILNLRGRIIEDEPASGTRLISLHNWYCRLQCPGGQASECALQTALCATGAWHCTPAVHGYACEGLVKVLRRKVALEIHQSKLFL